MKQAVYILLSVLIFSACDKLFLDVEGNEADLQGKWQQTPADTVYFNFQKSLFQYQIYVKKDSIKQAYGYYTLKENNYIQLDILLQTSQLPSNHWDWDIIPGEDRKDTLRQIFRIDLINSEKLVLSSGNETLRFHKF